MNNIKKGYYLNFLSVVMMAIGPLVSKFGLLHISPGKAALINTVTIIVVSYLWGIFTKNTVTFYFEKEVILLALFNACGVIFLFISMDLLSPVEVGFLGRFYTVFAVVLSVFILKEKMTRTEIIFIVLALFGAFMFVGEGQICKPLWSVVYLRYFIPFSLR